MIDYMTSNYLPIIDRDVTIWRFSITETFKQHNHVLGNSKRKRRTQKPFFSDIYETDFTVIGITDHTVVLIDLSHWHYHKLFS